MPRIARALYAAPNVRTGHPDGGLNLDGMVRAARRAADFHKLFGHRVDVVALVQDRVQRAGFTVPDAAVREALAE